MLNPTNHVAIPNGTASSNNPSSLAIPPHLPRSPARSPLHPTLTAGYSAARDPARSDVLDRRCCGRAVASATHRNCSSVRPRRRLTRIHTGTHGSPGPAIRCRTVDMRAATDSHGGWPPPAAFLCDEDR